MVRRLQLFEFTDLPRCPETVRRLVTDYLRFVLRLLRLDGPMASLLLGLIRHTGADRLVDLCSGASGPILPILRRLQREGVSVHVLLTDRFPNLPAFALAARQAPGAVDYVPEPIDATCVPAELAGIRTLFEGLHHFPPAQARAILADATRCGAPIAVFEVTARSLLPILGSFLLIPMVFLITPFIRPLTWWRLVLTYLLPVAPLVIFWDALVSSLRSYTVAELRALTEGLPGPPYLWEVGQVRHLGLPVTYLLGRPAT
ncbi:MAG: hypothetical protein RMK29_07360 [Myxococcales bacterium]|nr:hypothetical protein [Myxococcota bacterium]MDW8281511.1 hypothetical protein [Myxococcales bacterium]